MHWRLSAFGVDSCDERRSCLEFQANVGAGEVFVETKAASGVDEPEATESWSGNASPGLGFEASKAIVVVDVAELIPATGEGESAEEKSRMCRMTTRHCCGY